ncbi:outer membrane protein [Hydrobacter penzbergensis]|uniref:Outer membrane protein n=1 Tax=Hydrobacter penzbergensis TaxID=1235997 RepID=A0A8X8LCD2_9BACT|nr:TolC family protein [Hydrobacter penzbergensis]SDW17217.1 outer membrane protein [Hydrobacter penzbergensis]
MKQFLLFIGIASICVPGLSQRSSLTLRQCIETAIVNNADVKQQEFQLRTAAVNLNQAKGNLVPQLNGSINHALNQGRSIDPSNNSYINQQLTTANYSLGSSVTIFNGFKLLNTLKQNQYAYDAGKMDWQQSKDKLTLDIILAYLQVLNNEDLMEQATKQVYLSEQQVARLEIQDKAGAIKPSDLYDLKGQLASDQVTLINTRNARDAAKLSLAQLMNMPLDTSLSLERLGADQFDLSYRATADSIYQTAVSHLAAIKSVELKTLRSEKALRAAKGNLFPSLAIGGGINTNYSSNSRDALNNKIAYADQLKNNYGTYVGAGISLPILNNFRYKNQVAQAKIDLQNARFVDETAKIQLRQQVERDHLNMTSAKDRYTVLMEQVKAYTESFRAAEIRFEQGVGTSVDYLIAKNNLDRARSNLIIARYDYLLRTKILDYYQGKPLW